MDHGNGHAIKKLVELSGGLPVMLETFGSMCRDGRSPKSVLAELQRAQESADIPWVAGVGNYDYSTYFAGLEVQIMRLEKESLKVARCYSMLGVLPNETLAGLPLSLAAGMWGVSEAQAERYARQLADAHLIVPLSDKQGNEMWVRVLDWRGSTSRIEVPRAIRWRDGTRRCSGHAGRSRWRYTGGGWPVLGYGRRPSQVYAPLERMQRAAG